MGVFTRLAGALVDWRGDANGTANVAPYDAIGNRIAKRDKDILLATSEFMPLGVISDGVIRPARSDKMGNISIGFDTLELADPIEGATQNPLIWTNTLTTQTVTQAVSELILNGAAVTTINTGALIITNKQFVRNSRRALQAKARMRWSGTTNSVSEFGFGAPTTAISIGINNGAAIRLNSTGDLVVVLSFAGTDSAEVPIRTASQLAAEGFGNKYYTFDVILDDDSARFIIQGNGAVPFVDTTLSLGSGVAKLQNATHIPAFIRHFNSVSAPSAAGQIRISDFLVLSKDIVCNETFNQQLAGSHKGLHYNPLTFAQTANYTNNIAPTTRTPTNIAAGEATLGGQCSWNNAGTSFAASDVLDLAIFGFASPLPHPMIITELEIDTINLGAVNGATAYTIMYFLAFNQTAVSLATTIGRAIQILGFQTIPAAAPIGTPFSAPINKVLATSIVIDAGRFVVLGARVLSGTATASQVIRTIWTLKGVFK